MESCRPGRAPSAWLSSRPGPQPQCAPQLQANEDAGERVNVCYDKVRGGCGGSVETRVLCSTRSLSWNFKLISEPPTGSCFTVLDVTPRVPHPRWRHIALALLALTL